MEELIESSEALRRIFENLPEIPEISCPLEKCAGRILRSTLTADRDFPPFDRAMMDGYAFRASEVETGALVSVEATAYAGQPPVSEGPSKGSCIEIMTGAPLPPNADCVVPYEWTSKEEGRIKLVEKSRLESGDFVHRKGSDLRQGETLLEEGRVLGSREVALAAACGQTSLSVSKLPAITTACTGDELVGIDATPLPHQIRRSNDQAIDTAMARVGLNVKTATHLPDDLDTCRSAIKAMVESNHFVILTGGVSVGAKDFLPGILNDLQYRRVFHGVAQKPGKPMGYWISNDCGIFALPGNPVSVLTCLHQYVVPGIKRALGKSGDVVRREIRLLEKVKKPRHLTLFLPVCLQGDNAGLPRPARNSGDMVHILESDGYVPLPAGYDTVDTDLAYPFTPWV
ncbi:MAG: molybdopterin molybdotransferase MoeA [Verrucomicrobiota bacterium]